MTEKKHHCCQSRLHSYTTFIFWEMTLWTYMWSDWGSSLKVTGLLSLEHRLLGQFPICNTQLNQRKKVHSKYVIDKFILNVILSLSLNIPLKDDFRHKIILWSDCREELISVHVVILYLFSSNDPLNIWGSSLKVTGLLSLGQCSRRYKGIYHVTGLLTSIVLPFSGTESAHHFNKLPSWLWLNKYLTVYVRHPRRSRSDCTDFIVTYS